MEQMLNIFKKSVSSIPKKGYIPFIELFCNTVKEILKIYTKRSKKREDGILVKNTLLHKCEFLFYSKFKPILLIKKMYDKKNQRTGRYIQ